MVKGAAAGWSTKELWPSAGDVQTARSLLLSIISALDFPFISFKVKKKKDNSLK